MKTFLIVVLAIFAVANADQVQVVDNPDPVHVVDNNNGGLIQNPDQFFYGGNQGIGGGGYATPDISPAYVQPGGGYQTPDIRPEYVQPGNGGYQTPDIRPEYVQPGNGGYQQPDISPAYVQPGGGNRPGYVDPSWARIGK